MKPNNKIILPIIILLLLTLGIGNMHKRNEVRKQKEITIDDIAELYDYKIHSREAELRLQFLNGKEPGHWYGKEWYENDSSDNMFSICSYGDEYLLDDLPIHSKMRRCVYKNGIVVYYLDQNNSELKQDGTSAKLDGTDGNVMVEIPEFFYRVERRGTDHNSKISLKISEQGLEGFSFSPKQYVGAYEATVNHDIGKLASVCTTTFLRQKEEVKITDKNNFVVGKYSLGIKDTASRVGFTANAPLYRGGTNDAQLDCHTELTDINSCRNQLGLPVSNITRKDCRAYSDYNKGEITYQYDTQKLLWLLIMSESTSRNPQNTISAGATKYPSYSAYESFFVDTNGEGQGGLATIPCGVTNMMGNNTGEVYYKMSNVPISYKNGKYEFSDVWMPCMSYRGIEHWYGSLYKIADQIMIECTSTGQSANNGAAINRVKYYYQRNPFRPTDDIESCEFLGEYYFASNIANNTNLMFGKDAHILPINTVGCVGPILPIEYGGAIDTLFSKYYTDCCEVDSYYDISYISYNGRIVSDVLVGNNFLVGVYHIDGRRARANDGSRLISYDGVRLNN